MKNRHVFFGAIVIAAILGIALGGCAAKNAQIAMNTVRMLRTAGFEVKIADTPEKMERLKGLAQRKIVPYPHEGKMLYLYADAASCKCVYVGTPDDYQRYVEYQVAQGMAENNARAVQANAAATTPYNAGAWTVWW
jgi:hypothetical protein